MTCLSELTCAVYVDGELSPEEAGAVERHLAKCPACQTLVAALQEENHVLVTALRELEAPAPSRVAAAMPASPIGATNGHRTMPWVLILAVVAAAAGLAGWAVAAER